MSKILCLIPAKGASTRLPRKNIIEFADTSLLELAIQSAKQSGLCDKIVVSSEDREILDKALDNGVEALPRPQHLSVDPAGIVDVALAVLDSMDESFSTLIILSPTCPLRSVEDVTKAYELFLESNGRFLMSVTEYDHSPFSAWRVEEDYLAKPVFPDLCIKKSQELPKAYRCNGAVHIVDIPAFKREKSYTAEPLISYVMPRERSFDVDTAHDFWLAETYYKQFVRVETKD